MRQLFRELREQDEQYAPVFENVLEAARANGQQMNSGWQVWRLAVAVALLVVVIGSVFFFLKPFSTKPTIENRTDVPPAQTLEFADPPPTPSGRKVDTPKKSAFVGFQKKPSKKERSLYARPTQSPTQQLKPAMLISNWQSPTDALLKTPSAEFLKSIPKVGEPLFEMNKLFPNEMN
jgi:hypothetical protein